MVGSQRKLVTIGITRLDDSSMIVQLLVEIVPGKGSLRYPKKLVTEEGEFNLAKVCKSGNIIYQEVER